MDDEIWKFIPDHVGYMVSNKGRILNRRNNFMKLQNSKGYNVIGIRKGNISKRYLVHRLVAFAFIPNPENKPHINHKNGIRNDNRIENLEWCTRSENMQHAVKTGLQKILHGEERVFHKLTDKEVLEIRHLYKKTNTTQVALAEKYKVSKCTMWNIVHNKNWRHLL